MPSGLMQRIEQDIKDAQRQQDAVKLDTLRGLKSALRYWAIEKKKETPDDADILGVLSKQIKQREDSIDQFRKGNRQDLVDKETRELKILQGYQPPAMSDPDLRRIVEQAIGECGAQGPKDMGKVMKAVMEKAAGRADGKRISQLVSEALKS